MDKDIIDNLYIVDDSLLLKKSTIRSPDPGLNYILTEDHSNNYSINWRHSIYDYYNPTFFIEGKSTDSIIEINILQSRVQEQINITLYKQLNENGFFKFHELPIAKYKLKSNNWYKIINKNQEMIRGYIECIHYMNKCEIDPSQIYFRCFRSEDSLFIGNYPLVDGSAIIPNLDCNTEYDIIFVDSSKVLEQKVQSRRKPVPYNPITTLYNGN